MNVDLELVIPDVELTELKSLELRALGSDGIRC